MHTAERILTPLAGCSAGPGVGAPGPVGGHRRLCAEFGVHAGSTVGLKSRVHDRPVGSRRLTSGSREFVVTASRPP